VIFDCAEHSTTSIQWAAFYSDCEHEVHEVTAGHRITLRYNLYLTTRVDLQAGTESSLDATRLPFADFFKAALSEPRFMYKGGKIGICLTHHYPHTHNVLSKALPRCLKGIEMAVFEAAGALGLKRSLICTTKESMSDYIAEEFGYEDDYGEEHRAFGMYYPRLKTLTVTDEMVGDEYYGDLDGAHPMYEGEFVWLNNAKYKELSSAFLAVSYPSTSRTGTTADVVHSTVTSLRSVWCTREQLFSSKSQRQATSPTKRSSKRSMTMSTSATRSLKMRMRISTVMYRMNMMMVVS